MVVWQTSTPVVQTMKGFSTLRRRGFGFVATMLTPLSYGPEKSQISVFYDVRPDKYSKSNKENDEAHLLSSNPLVVSRAKERLKNFTRFQDLCRSLQMSGIDGVFLITCRVMQATGFMTMTQKKFGVPILGYTRRVKIAVQASGRTRFYLQGDETPGSGTNIPMGEIFAPCLGSIRSDFVYIGHGGAVAKY
jgi:hypothetical protein